MVTDTPLFTVYKRIAWYYRLITFISCIYRPHMMVQVYWVAANLVSPNMRDIAVCIDLGVIQRIGCGAPHIYPRRKSNIDPGALSHHAMRPHTSSILRAKNDIASSIGNVRQCNQYPATIPNAFMIEW